MSAPHYSFSKLHGLGNDFILIDARQQAFTLSPEQIQAWSCRHTGIGCDQWLILETPRTSDAVASYRVFNADGSSAEQCLNGLRCIGWYLFRQYDLRQMCLDSPGGPVTLWITGESDTNRRTGSVRVALAAPSLGAQAVAWHGTLSQEHEPPATLALDLPKAQLQACAVNMGNPHAVVFVTEARSARARYGAAVSTHPDFAAGVNAGFAQVCGDHQLFLAVCERGSGPTRACGSGACAAAVAALHQGRVKNPVQVTQPGGTVVVDWQGPEQPVYLEGPAEFVFSGEFVDESNG